MTRDIGPDLVKELHKLVQIEDEWSEWHHDRSFTWWPSTLAQTLIADPAYDDDGMIISPVTISTDLFKNVTEEQVERFFAATALSSLSGIAPHRDDPSRMVLTVTVRVHEENLTWMRRLAMLIMLMQAQEARQMALLIMMTGDIDTDDSEHPQNGVPEVWDEVFDFFEEQLKPAGAHPPDLALQDLKPFVDLIPSPPVIESLVTSDQIIISLPVSNSPATLTINAIKHPIYGYGALLVLHTEVDAEPKEVCRLAVDMNADERDLPTTFYGLGGWWAHPSGLGHVVFIPNILLRAGLLQNLLLSQLKHAEWLCENSGGLGNCYILAKVTLLQRRARETGATN